MSRTIKHETAASRTTGIAAASINAGVNYLGSEIDNSTNKDTDATIEVAFTCGVAPTANKTIEVYLIYAVDGSNYEDGAVAVDPTLSPNGIVAARAVTAAQKVTIKGLPIMPFKFKVLLKSELNQNATGVTVLLYSHNKRLV